MGWYEAIKDVVTVADRLRDVELKQKLADVQVECAKLAEENSKIRQELIDLREQVNIRQEMEYQNDVYWRRVEKDRYAGPYCPKCLDGDKKAARMSNRPDDFFWRCPVCRYEIEKPGSSSWLLPRQAEINFDPFAD